MQNRCVVVFVLISAVSLAVAQEPNPGLTLIAPSASFDTHLQDLDGNVVKTWHGSQRPRSFAYMLPDSSIIRPCRDTDGAFNITTAGGRIQRIDADDTIVWDYFFSDQTHQQHHDIEPMPNGNVLILAWELRTLQEAVDMGVVGATDDLWPTLIAEVEQDGPTGGNIIWEWHIWDHMVQDVDPGKPTYGVIADHPELLDMNSDTLNNSSDWVHENSVDYNPELDQVIFCSRRTCEFYIIDHSTTTAEAAGHTGGDSGRGGDFLYRWGNPRIYGRGTEGDQYIDIAHAVNWVDAGLPGAGNVLIFDNGDSGYSSVYEVTPPMEPDGTYTLDPVAAYGPASATWTYGGPGGFYGGATQCGAFRLPNGNTLITATVDGLVFEVTPAGATVWEYDDPGRISRALRYWDDTTAVPPNAGHMVLPSARLGPIHPNPFNPATVIGFEIDTATPVMLAVYDVQGRRVRILLDGIPMSAGAHRETWDGRDDRGDTLGSGVYFARMETPGVVATRKLTMLK